jgi:hypothetical protein
MSEPKSHRKPTDTLSSTKPGKSFRPPHAPEAFAPPVPELPLDHDVLDLIVAGMSGLSRYRDVERVCEAVLFTDVERGERFEIVVRPAEEADDDSDPPPSPIPGMMVSTRLPKGQLKRPAPVDPKALRAGALPPRPKR